MDNKDILQVRMLGGFTITWRGNQISSGSRDSQFTRLMEILLHYSDTGVGRAQLEEMLFDDSRSTDPHHMLRSVIYNSKKKLEREGLPHDCIVFSNGIYRWTETIPVEEDAKQFEEMVRRAGEVEDPEERAKRYQDACFFYRGEFLPDQTGSFWVMQEERRYYDMFCRSMEQALDYHRSLGNFVAMEKLGKYAAKVHPLSD